MGKIISNGIEYGGSSIINEINGVFIDTNNIIIPLTEYKSSMTYTATEDCYAILYTVFGSNTAIRINSEMVGNFDGSGNLGITNNFYLKNGQTISVANASSSYNSYYIIYGIQQGSQDTTKNEIYSTEERAIGTWVDGSTIYEKTIYHTGGVTGYISILHGITNLNRVISLEGSALDYYTSEGDLRISNMILPRIALDDNNIGISSITNTEVQLSVGSIWSDRVRDIYITLKYTKTTT